MLPLVAPAIILGGILGGIVTPTEAAVLAVLYALLLGLVIYREIRPRDILPMLINTASLTGMVMLLVGTASVLSWIFAAQGIPRLIAAVLLGLSSDATLVLLVTILVFVPLGAILEGVPAMIILVPVFFPIIARFGIDPLHYGTLVVAALGLGLFVPPFGVGFFIACALGRTTVETARARVRAVHDRPAPGPAARRVRAVDHARRAAADEALSGIPRAPGPSLHEWRERPLTAIRRWAGRR